MKRFSGILTVKCMLSMIDEMFNDPLYVEGLLEINNLLDVEKLDISSENVDQITEMFIGLSPIRKLATNKAIISTDPEIIAASKAIDDKVNLAQEHRYRYFSTLEEALDGLGLSQDPFFSHHLLDDSLKGVKTNSAG